MTKKNIAQLLQRFMEGETSLDEERLLAEYFRTHEVEEEWKAYQDMFAFIEGEAKKEKGTTPTRRLSFLRIALSTAAALVVAVLLWQFAPKQNEGSELAQHKRTAKHRPRKRNANDTLRTTPLSDSTAAQPAEELIKDLYKIKRPEVYYAEGKTDKAQPSAQVTQPTTQVTTHPAAIDPEQAELMEATIALSELENLQYELEMNTIEAEILCIELFENLK